MIRRAKRSLALGTAMWLAFAVSALANTFSVSGPGGSIPAPVGTPGTWDSTYTGTPFTSSVTVLRNVTSITKVRLSGFEHTWRGDLHIVLKSPTASFNIVVRPGSNGTTAGHSGDYLTGDYEFVANGGASVVAQGAAVNLSGGIYNQYFNVGNGQWTSGISNTPLSGITGPAGTWTLEIRDWAPASTGALLGWTLEGITVIGFTQFCFGTFACPCGPASPTGGCQNENLGQPTGGAEMTASSSGLPPSVSADTGTAFPSTQVSLAMTDAAFTSLAVFLEGDTQIAPTLFGDGLVCVSWRTRLNGAAPAGDLTDGAGNLTYPNAVHTKSICDRYLEAQGVPHPTGSFYYFAGYRDPGSPFCPGGSEFNFSSAIELVWGP